MVKKWHLIHSTVWLLVWYYHTGSICLNMKNNSWRLRIHLKLKQFWIDTVWYHSLHTYS